MSAVILQLEPTGSGGNPNLELGWPNHLCSPRNVTNVLWSSGWSWFSDAMRQSLVREYMKVKQGLYAVLKLSILKLTSAVSESELVFSHVHTHTHTASLMSIKYLYSKLLWHIPWLLLLGICQVCFKSTLWSCWRQPQFRNIKSWQCFDDREKNKFYLLEK